MNYFIVNKINLSCMNVFKVLSFDSFTKPSQFSDLLNGLNVFRPVQKDSELGQFLSEFFYPIFY